jgi:hypothetical protein
MPKSKTHRPKDVNQLAHHLVNISTSEEQNDISPPSKAQISMFMSRLGKKGGKIGGKRRLETMTKKERSDIARKAARARWQAK